MTKARIGIRMGEFVDPARFPLRLREVLDVKNRLLLLLGGEPLRQFRAHQNDSLPLCRKFIDDLVDFFLGTDINAAGRII